ncbi:MAG: phosphoribosylformylglycinamidine synthase, partial [Oscillospiraceae bacterium]|nr:phosphoribosylformylglycinamidine synthase [Oscillospiraceae bacterium]
MGVFRCYSEKREGFDVEAQALARDLRDFLGIYELESVRLLNRYDVEGITESIYRIARENVFSEPQVDDCYDETPPEFGIEARTLIVEMLPGQYDQRADSCAQCIQMITRGDLPTVKAAKLYALTGNLTGEDMAKVREYLINPVESREASPEKPDTLTVDYPEPEPVKTLHGFIKAGDDALNGYLQAFGLAMDLNDLRFMQKYFAETERRDPTETELRMIDTYWSDHCRHTTFNTHITNVSIDDADINAAYKAYLDARHEVYGDNADSRPQTLMDIATIAAKVLRKRGLLSNIDISEEVNACSIHVDVDVDGKTEDWLLMFKNETHNHPTEIEPFGGAATCVGGAIRDPLSGRAYVYQAMRITGAGDPSA